MPFTRNTTLLSEHQCGAKYDLGNAQMFVIEGMDRVQKVIEENRERRLTKHKKIPNSTVIEIDNCSPLDILKPQKNLPYLEENGITSHIKLQDHEQRKTRAYKEDIGKYYNMRYEVFEDEHYYVCHAGRELRHIRTETKEQDGYAQTFEVYGCADCSGCPHKAKCLYKQGSLRPKISMAKPERESHKDSGSIKT